MGFGIKWGFVFCGILYSVEFCLVGLVGSLVGVDDNKKQGITRERSSPCRGSCEQLGALILFPVLAWWTNTICLWLILVTSCCRCFLLPWLGLGLLGLGQVLLLLFSAAESGASATMCMVGVKTPSLAFDPSLRHLPPLQEHDQ